MEKLGGGGGGVCESVSGLWEGFLCGVVAAYREITAVGR